MIKDIKWKSLGSKLWKDFLYLLSNPIPLSFSKMSSYQTCAYKYKLIYTEHQPSKPSPYLAYGTIMHDTFFEFESIPYGVKREYADLERIFQKNWELHIETYRRKWGKSIYDLIAAERGAPAEELEKEAYDTAILMLKNYWRESQQNPNKVRYVEKWLFGELGHYHVTGRLDRLDQRPDGSYEIIDYKTGQRISNEETLKDASRGYGLQAGVYYEMCKEAWRDRIDRFIFKYLQKRQIFVEYLVADYLSTVQTASLAALAENAPPILRQAQDERNDPGLQPAALTAAVIKAVREKLEEKLLKKVVAEREEARVRDEIRKIRLEEEQDILKTVSETERPAARLFLKTLNKYLEQRISEEVAKAAQDKAVLNRYEEDTRRVIREVLSGLDETRIAAAVSKFSEEIETDFRDRAQSRRWPQLPTPERERIVTEIIETIYRREVKERSAGYLKNLTAETLSKKTAKILEAAPEIRADRRTSLVSHCVDRLRASFSQGLDVYSPDEIAKVLAESAPDGFFTADYTARTNKMLDDLVKRARIGEGSTGRNLSRETVAAAQKQILLLPLIETIKKIVLISIEGVIEDMLSDRSDVLTPAHRQKYSQLLKNLTEPLFVQTVTQKVSTAYANHLYQETCSKLGTVPIVEHITRLFERPDVMKILERLDPGPDTARRKAKAQNLIEKLDWWDAGVLVEGTLNPVLAAWRATFSAVLSPHIREAVEKRAAPEAREKTLADAAELFENRLVRVCTLDVEVPYSPEMRANVIRAIEQVQDGIRRKDFSPSRGALCGWCEYQAGCPAWCKYSDLCKDVCKDTYNCKKWFDEKTGRLVEGRPAGMTHEEYLRRVAEKYDVTDKSLFRLSFSKMNSFELCPMNYRKLYLDKVSPKPKSFFSIGLSFHQTMEDLYAYTGPNIQPSLKMLLDIFKKKWISAGYKSREEEDFNFRRGLRMCEDYYEAYIDGKYKPAGAAEDYFEFKVGHHTLLCGFIDRVDQNDDGTISIIDYKTNPKLYTQEELDEDQQMNIYYLAAREGKLQSQDFRPVEVKQFVFQFVNFCKDMVATRDPSYLGALQSRVQQFTEEMEWRQKTYKNSKFDPRVGMLLFPPQDNKYCQSCDHHHVCPLKTDMTLSGEIQKKGTQFEDAVDAKELMDESSERVATYDVA